MNEVNQQRLPAGRLGEVVELIPDEVAQMWCHLPFPCLFTIGNDDLLPWDLIRSRQRLGQIQTNPPVQVYQPLTGGGYFGV